MELVLLAGNSIHNKAWIEEVEKELEPLFSKTYVHYYWHWQEGRENIDIAHEIKSLANELKGRNYVIFAKSIGSVVAAKGIYNKMLDPKKCIFLGIPLIMINKLGLPFDKWVKNCSLPILFIQNYKDPFGSFSEVKKYLGNGSNIKESTGDTHNYNDILWIKNQTKEFLSGDIN